MLNRAGSRVGTCQNVAAVLYRTGHAQMMSQQNISPDTPNGGNLVGGGATFRVYAPRATEVYLHGTFGGVAYAGLTDDRLMVCKVTSTTQR